MTINGKVILKKGKEISIRRFHPWIFSGAIQRTEGNVPDGGWVQVVDFKDQTLGFGHYQHGSITVRMLSFLTDLPSENFWAFPITNGSSGLVKMGQLGRPNRR